MDACGRDAAICEYNAERMATRLFPMPAREFELLHNARALIGLGAIGFDATLKLLNAHGIPLPKPRPKFRRNPLYPIGDYAVIGTYHPSRQNTNTGRLTAAMFDRVFESARRELSE